MKAMAQQGRVREGREHTATVFDGRGEHAPAGDVPGVSSRLT
jgi:hypothetical protein